MALTNATATAVELAVVGGDLSKLKPEERLSYYNQVCRSVSLNPLTRPFEYITLNGKLTLYCKRDAAEQLRQLHGVSIKIVDARAVDGLYIVKAAATDKKGRTDEASGAVAVIGLKGEALANAFMKAETKAKRRVTLSLCGLGWLDESEAEGLAGAVEVKDGWYPSAATNPEAVALGAATAPAAEPPVEPPVEQLGDAGDWPIWVQDIEEQIAGCETLKDLQDNWAKWTKTLIDLKRSRPDLHQKMIDAKDQRKAELLNADNTRAG